MRRPTIAAIGVVLALVACSGNDDEESATPSDSAGIEASTYDAAALIGFEDDPVAIGECATDNGGEAGITGTLYSDSVRDVTVELLAATHESMTEERSAERIDVELKANSKQDFKIEGLSNGEHTVIVREVAQDEEDHPEILDDFAFTIAPCTVDNPVPPGRVVIYLDVRCDTGEAEGIAELDLRDTPDNHENAEVFYKLDGKPSEYESQRLLDGHWAGFYVPVTAGGHTIEVNYEDDLGFTGTASYDFTVPTCDQEEMGQRVVDVFELLPTAR